MNKAFTGLVPTLSKEQFKDALTCILQRANVDYQTEERAEQYTTKTETLLHFMWLLMDNCNAGELIRHVMLLIILPSLTR